MSTQSIAEQESPIVSQTWAERLLFSKILAFFFVSGMCGLLYQVVWTRKLVLLFGTTSYAVSTVLSIFFLGLALGSVWGGRLADRTPNPLRWYGWMEIIIGLWAVLFILGINTGESLIVDLLRTTADSRAGGISVRIVLVTVMLIVPVTLMGATLPLLARFITRDPRVRGFRIGSLYSLNTMGAVAGCAITGFLLIPDFGYTRTTIIGALANVAVGILAWRLSMVSETDGNRVLDAPPAQEPLPASGEDTGADEAPPARIAALIMIAFAVSGFCALALEVLWTRMLTIVFIGTTYAYTTMLTTLLCGIGLGGAAGALIADRSFLRGKYVALFGVVQILGALMCLWMLGPFAELPQRLEEMRINAGYEWAKVVQAKFYLSFSVLFLPTFLFGTTFPIAVRAVTGGLRTLGRRVGRLYGANTIGGVVGAAAGGFLLIPLLGTHWGVVSLGLLLAATGAVLVLMCPTTRVPVKGGLLAATAVAMFPVWQSMPGDVGRALNQWFVPEDEHIIHYAEGVEGTVVITEPEEVSTGTDRVLWINAVQATASIEKGVRMNRFDGALPMLFDFQPDNALFMCFGTGITAGTLGLWDQFEQIDAVEISPEVLDAAPYFKKDNFDVLNNEKFNFVVDDGRNFLLTSTKKYDVITFEPMPLALAGVSTFYTKEYYELCLNHLAPGGIVTQWIPLHSLTPEIVRDLVYTFTDVFPEYTMWIVNADLFMVGSDEPLAIDLDKVEQRFAQPEIQEALAPIGLADPVELLTMFVMGKEKLNQFVEGGRIMLDDRPWAEFKAPKVMNERHVQDGFRELLKYYESPEHLIAFDSPEEREQWLEAINRRFESKKVTKQAQIEYYSATTIGDHPEETFMKALEIDPENANAQYYLKEILKSRVKVLLRWREFEQGIDLLERAQTFLPEEPMISLQLGHYHYEMGEKDRAAGYYQEYLDLGGVPELVEGRLAELE